MITIFVSNMSASIRFYTEVLSMKLGNRYGNEFAIVHGTDGLTIGLHPASAKRPAGKVAIGIQVAEPIQEAVSVLKEKGVTFKTPVVDDKDVLAADFCDPDGAELYLVEIKQRWQGSA
jgi:catechol 2,3-dioxygenase-like lactoylglutathione lyase family enzyme